MTNKIRVLTYDKASIEDSVRSFDENGYMHVDVSNITKEQVAPYRGDEIPNFRQLGFDPGTIYHGYRPAEELAKPATVESLNGIPVLLEHHPDSAAAPAKDYRVGSTGTDARWDAPYLTNSLHIQDEDAISRIKDGSMRELSLGYFYTPIRQEGEFNGEHYDFIMTDIACNHVALVEKGRAGPDVLVGDSQLKEADKMDEPIEKAEVALAEAAKSNMEALVDLHHENPVTGEVTDDELTSVTEEKPMEEEAKDSALEIFVKKCVEAGLDPEKVKEDLDAVIAEAKTTEDEDLEEETVEEEKVTEDEDDETAEDGCDRDLTEDAEEALKECGLDADDPVIRSAFQKGFAEGTKWGEKVEKKEPEKLDREHESEGEKRALGEDSAKKIARMVKQEIESKYNAIEEVRGSLGKVRVSAFDSAADVYAAALKAEGVNIKGFKKSECRNAYRALMTVQAKRARVSAMDSAAKSSGSNMSKILSNVRVGD